MTGWQQTSSTRTRTFGVMHHDRTARAFWPAAVIGVALATAIAVYGELGATVQLPLVLLFLLLAPGMAIARLLRLNDALTELLIAVALSLALDTLVSLALLFAGVPSPDVALAGLLGITVVATLLDPGVGARALLRRLYP